MGSQMVRLSLLMSIGSCQDGSLIPLANLLPSLVPWLNSSVASLLRNEPEERVYDPNVLGNLAKKGKIADLRVPHSQSFVVYISVGTPPQTMRCLVDTGFADLWLPSEKCQGCSESRYFRPERSRTFAEVREPRATGSASSSLHPNKTNLAMAFVQYGGGAVEGLVGQDTIALGWGVLKNQSFLLVPQAFLPKKRDWDGICGLGRHQIVVGEEPLWKRMPAVSPGGRAVFALVPGPGRRHYFVAGEVPYRACKEGTLSWASVEPLRPGGDRRFWVVSGGLAIHRRTPIRSRFLLDTGSSFLLAPPNKYLPFVHSLFALDDFDRLCGWDAAAGNAVVCNCSIMQDSSQLLPLRVYIGGRAFLMQIPELFRRVPTGKGGELCLLQIQRNPAGATDPLDLLGDLLDRRKAEDAPSRPPLPPFGAKQAAGLGDLFTAPLSAMGPGPALLPRGRLSDIPSEKRERPPEEDAASARRLQALGPTPIDLEDDLWVMGGVFLERFVVVLDFDGERVGVAEPGDEVLSPDLAWGPGSALQAPPAQEAKREGRTAEERLAEEGKEVAALEEKNAVLKDEVHGLVRVQEEAVLKEKRAEVERNNLAAYLQNLEQQNRELNNRVEKLQYSQEQIEVKSAKLQQEVSTRRVETDHLKLRLEDWRIRHAALQRRSNVLREERESLLARAGRLREERESFQARAARMQLAALAACGFIALLLLTVAIVAWKARHQLLLVRKGAVEGTAREVRDVAPLLETDSPPASPKAFVTVDGELE